MQTKEQFKKTAEATGDLVGNKIEDKITSYSTELHSKKPASELYSNVANNEIPKERYIFPQERHKIIDELILI